MGTEADLMGMPERALRIAHDVREAGGRALIVGGWVRDQLLGRESKDVDIEVFGLDADRLRVLLESIGRVEAVGESFQVFKSGDVDVSLPRRESKAGRGHRGFAVQGDPSMSVEEAARRRDFTINAISWDPLTGEHVDPYRWPRRSRTPTAEDRRPDDVRGRQSAGVAGGSVCGPLRAGSRRGDQSDLPRSSHSTICRPNASGARLKSS